MISKNKMREIDKQEHLGNHPKCPNCNATLEVRRKYFPVKMQGEKYISRDVIVIAKCLNCGEYGEYTYDEMNIK